MEKNHSKSAILIVIMVLVNIGLYGQDWTQFRGPGLNSKVSGFKAPATWPSELKQIWKVTVGTGDASPVISGKYIFLHTRQGENEIVLCLDSGSGKEVWKYSYPAPAVTGPAGSHPGPRGTPAISDGRIVTFGVSGILTCLDTKTGKLLWKKENPANAFPQFNTGTSPLIAEGLCFIYTGSKGNGEVTAFDLKTGTEKWKWSGEGPAYSTPSILTIDGNKQIILLSEANLISLGFTDGKLLWKVPTPQMQRFYNCVSPYVSGNKIYFTGQGAGTKCHSVENQGGNYNTTEVWSNPAVGAKWNTPVLKENFLYGFSDTRKIYCLNATNGQTAWVDQAVNSDFATLVDCGSVLIGLPSTGNLIVFKPDPGAYSEIIRYKVAETPVYAYPLISGNNIYIKDAESLTLFSIN